MIFEKEKKWDKERGYRKQKETIRKRKMRERERIKGREWEMRDEKRGNIKTNETGYRETEKEKENNMCVWEREREREIRKRGT